MNVFTTGMYSLIIYDHNICRILKTACSKATLHRVQTLMAFMRSAQQVTAKLSAYAKADPAADTTCRPIYMASSMPKLFDTILSSVADNWDQPVALTPCKPTTGTHGSVQLSTAVVNDLLMTWKIGRQRLHHHMKAYVLRKMPGVGPFKKPRALLNFHSSTAMKRRSRANTQQQALRKLFNAQAKLLRQKISKSAIELPLAISTVTGMSQTM